jgi:hypothetical protein
MASQKKELQTCKECTDKMFPIYTPHDGEYVTCPLCSNWCLKNDSNILEYCKDCKIVFNLGCIHGKNETGDCYNAALMVGFVENNKQYDGMLVFTDDDCANKFVNRASSSQLQVLLQCMCVGESYTCREAGIKSDVCKCTYN